MRTALAASLFISFSLLAQTPQKPETSGQKFDDPLDKAAKLTYIERYADTVRAKKAFDDAHRPLHTAAFRDALRKYDGTSPITLTITWDELITSSGTQYVPLQLGIPNSIKPKGNVVAFGELLDEKGKTVIDFEEPANLQTSKSDLFSERTMFLPAGKMTGTFGIAVGTEIVALGRTVLDIPEITKTSAGVSHLLVSNNVYNLPRVQSMFEPFAFGGTKVVPKPDRAFTRGDELWLFTELRNPKVGTNGLPNVAVTVAIERDGKSVAKMPVTIEPLALKGVDGHFGLGTTLDLSSLKRGEYKLHVTLTDALAKQTYEREETIKLVE